jgi:NADPH-dependent 2,4-dienoyl-CoA reductase/sulfur reductase-like enzyme
LVVATGAVPVHPPIDGLDLDRVHVLHTMGDTFALHQALTAGARSAVIVGGGYIGLEMAEAFTARGLSATLVEQASAVMPTVDLDLGELLGQELRRHGVQVVNDVTVKAIRREAGALVVAGEPDFGCAADLVLVVVGVRPDTDLAVAAGVETGVRGALRVDRRMRTNLADVLAAGDCVETYHRLLDQPSYLPLGTTAHKQGRVAGQTAVGGTATFAGSLGTQVVKVFDLAVARTGLSDAEAAAAGFDPVTVGSVQFDHKAYYPGAHQLHLRITGDRVTGRLLGAQLLGHHDAEIAKCIDIPASALFHAMTVEGLSDLDLSYTPPFGSPWDAVQMAAQTWTRQTQGGRRPRRPARSAGEGRWIGAAGAVCLDPTTPGRSIVAAALFHGMTVDRAHLTSADEQAPRARAAVAPEPRLRVCRSLAAAGRAAGHRGRCLVAAEPDTAEALAVRCCFRNRGRCPDGWPVSGRSEPPRTLPPPVSVRNYRNRSPGRRPAARVPPLPVRAGELALEAVAELGAHVGHGRPLQGQGVLGGQPAQPQAQQVAALPAGHHRVGGRLWVDSDLGPGVGRPGAQLHGEVGEGHQLPGCPVSSSDSSVPSGCGTQGCSSDAGATTSTPAGSVWPGESRRRPR